MQTSLFPLNKDIDFLIFSQTELGQLYQAIPFEKLAAPFEKHLNNCPQGRKAIFSIEGGIGLLFLKHYLKLSDEKLIMRVNADWQLQMFCQVYISRHNPVKDKDIVGRWRRFFAEHGDLEQMQEILLEYWQPYMEQTHIRLDDATVFESYIKYPTDVKLLWDSVNWVWNQIVDLCQKAGLRKLRWNYKYHKKRQLIYAKRKRKTRKKERARRRELLKALQHILGLLQGLLNRGDEIVDRVGSKFFSYLKVIKIVWSQQRYHYDHPGKRVPNRIVSLYKPYIRPIVRGKENKRVEFGAKVHISQVDGINLIEHLSFDTFHEGRRLWRSVFKHQQQFGQLRQYGGDQIYASNANRKFLKKRGIATCFKKKGRAAKATAEQESQMRVIIGKARATRLEGSFGNEKNNYLLKKVKARTQKTEVIWIFFGIHASNALIMGRRMLASQQQAQAA